MSDIVTRAVAAVAHNTSSALQKLKPETVIIVHIAFKEKHTHTHTHTNVYQRLTLTRFLAADLEELSRNKNHNTSEA